jgi:hypothetical protein
MTEFNLVNLKQGIGLLGASEKLQTCLRATHRQEGKTGKEQGQMMPFLCMMGEICRITTQETEKTNQPLLVKGRGAKTNRSLPGKINLLLEKGGQKQTGAGKAEVGACPPSVWRGRSLPAVSLAGSELARRQSGGVGGGRAEMADAPGLLKFSLKNAVVVKGKSNSFIPVKNGGKNDIGNPLKHLGLKGEAKAVIGKNAASVFRDGGQKQTGAGKAEVGACPPSVWRGRSLPAVSLAGSELARRQSGGVGGGRAEMADAPGLLKFSLKNAVVVKGKSHRGTSPPECPSDRDFSAGAYHHTSFHSGGSSSAINESVNSYDIEPRALINQIANSIKKPGRVKITLNPPRLGTLDVDVLVRDNKVHVILQTENNDVRQILQSNVESLKSSLRNQGLVADTINVSVQEKPDSANYGPNHGPGQSETLFREGRNREGNEEDHGGEQDSLNHDPSSFKEENPSVRSDGRVSLFA